MTDDLRKALAEPTVDLVVAGKLLGVGAAATYRARAAGHIPAVKIGRQWRVPTAKLREMLGLKQEAAAA